MDNEQKPRYRVSIDTVSLEEADAVMPSAEEIALGDIAFADIMKQLSTDRQRFIALALHQGWNKADIAYMLQVSLSDITHITKRMQIKLAMHRTRHKRW